MERIIRVVDLNRNRTLACMPYGAFRADGRVDGPDPIFYVIHPENPLEILAYLPSPARPTVFQIYIQSYDGEIHYVDDRRYEWKIDLIAESRYWDGINLASSMAAWDSTRTLDPGFGVKQPAKKQPEPLPLRTERRIRLEDD